MASDANVPWAKKLIKDNILTPKCFLGISAAVVEAFAPKTFYSNPWIKS